MSRSRSGSAIACASSRGTASRPSHRSRRSLLSPEPRLPAFRVEEPGALDLLLDGGRLNQSHHGMAQSGPLDARAARLANALAGNPPGTTLIESTLNGPTLARAARRGRRRRRPRPAAARRRAAGRPDDDARAQGPAGRPAADRRGRARLPRPRGRDRRRAVPGLDERRPDRPDRQPAHARRRARPRPRRRRPAGDAGAAAGDPVPPRAPRAPRPAVVARGRGRA